VGYTPYYTAAVWTGYDQQESMGNLTNPSPVLWKQVMQKVHAYLPYEPFDVLSLGHLNGSSGGGMVSALVCDVSGELATEFCAEHAQTLQLFKEDVPVTYCTVHVAPPPFDINNPESWPVDDPNFNPEDPSTHPGYEPPLTPENPPTGEEPGGEPESHPGESNPPEPPPPEPPAPESGGEESQ
jgi:penicillin-binding protein 1A